MKQVLLTLAVFIVLPISACISRNTTDKIDEKEQTVAEEQCVEEPICEVQDSVGEEITESLNAIRFKNWGKKEWLDNDYIRALRSYIDDFHAGEIENDDLEPYRERIRSKFIIASIEPYLSGGAYVGIIFVDMPNRIFVAWVYSYVDDETKDITGYDVRAFRIEEDEVDNTKEDILRALKEEPLLRLW